MRGRAGAAFLVAVAVTATAAPGAAAKTKVLRGDFKSVGPGQQVSQKVGCPSGLRVSGGGTYTDGSSLEDEVADSYPFDGRDEDTKPDDGWKGAINGGPGGAQMQTWAMCTDAVKLTYSSAPAQPVSFGGRVTVPCPAEQDPVSGGMRVPGKLVTSPLKGSILSGLPAGWESSVINLTSPTPTGYAICSPSKRVEHAGGSLNLGPSSQGKLEMPCPDGSTILGGGGTGDSTNQLELASLLPSDADDDDGKPDDGWTTWFNNESATETDSMNSHALCLRPRG